MRRAPAFLCLVLGLAALPTGAAEPFSSLAQLHAALVEVAQTGAADGFWSRVLASGEMPLVFGSDVVFLWRGRAESVEWRGDFSSWRPAPENAGKRLGATDIWSFERSLPRDGRFDYKLVLDGKDWLLDPLNPHQQLGGYGPNSELRMPDWRPPENVVRRAGTARGAFSEDLAFASAKLGYAVNYRVYVPAGLDLATAGNLPVLYVTDGYDYWTDGMGALVVTLDTLLAERRIEPLLAVFVDPWDSGHHVNRRDDQYVPAADRACAFCEFLADELVPAIDAKYPTRRTRDGRAIVGTSLGGLNAAVMMMRYGDRFGLAGVQSPALRAAPWVLAEAGRTQPPPIKVFISGGTFEADFLDSARRLRDALTGSRVDVRFVETHQGHSWGQWRELLDDLLLYFYGKS